MDKVAANIMQFLSTLMLFVVLASAIFASIPDTSEQDRRAEEFHQLYQEYLERTEAKERR